MMRIERRHSEANNDKESRFPLNEVTVNDEQDSSPSLRFGSEYRPILSATADNELGRFM